MLVLLLLASSVAAAASGGDVPAPRLAAQQVERPTELPRAEVWFDRNSPHPLRPESLSVATDGRALFTWQANIRSPELGLEAVVTEPGAEALRLQRRVLAGLDYCPRGVDSIWWDESSFLLAGGCARATVEGIWLESISAKKGPPSNPRLVTDSAEGVPRAPRLAKLPADRAALFWAVEGAGGDTLLAELLLPSGEPVGARRRLSRPAALASKTPYAVAALPTGGVAMAWTESLAEGGSRIVLQRFNDALEPAGEAFTSDVPEGAQTVATLVSSSAGHLGLAWETRHPGRHNTMASWIQRFAPDGSVDGAIHRLIPPEHEGSARSPRLAWSRSSAELLAVWWQEGPEDPFEGLWAQVWPATGGKPDTARRIARGQPGEWPMLAVWADPRLGFEIAWRDPDAASAGRVLRLLKARWP